LKTCGRTARLFDAGVIVTINTDDVLVFGQGVSEEFWNLFEARPFDAFTEH
jgi:adenosine deaminase